MKYMMEQDVIPCNSTNRKEVPGVVELSPVRILKVGKENGVGVDLQLI